MQSRMHLYTHAYWQWQLNLEALDCQYQKENIKLLLYCTYDNMDDCGHYGSIESLPEINKEVYKDTT